MKKKFLPIILGLTILGSIITANVLAEYTDIEDRGIAEASEDKFENNWAEILNEKDVNQIISEAEENKLVSDSESVFVSSTGFPDKDIELMVNLNKHIVININGESVTLEAEKYTDGDIYVAFYKSSGQLVSIKRYSSTMSNINVITDEKAAYAKVMWWNEDLLPNCETKKIKLKDQYSIIYHIANNDDYLKSITIENPNPDDYFTQDGLILQDLIVDGYNFLGWYTAQSGGERVTEIKTGEIGNKTLYAHWEKVEYTISFASDMVPVYSIKYTAGETKVLPKPVLDKYTFVGWSDDDGNMWTAIPKGTTGNITLYANWASNRNKAEAIAKLGDPIICEDTGNGLILFTYEIGTIKNVPLFETLKLQCANGIISTVSKTETSEISSTQATTIAQTVANATTNSSSWTLSTDWNETTEVSQSYLDQTGQTREEAETLAKSETGAYNFTTGQGGSHSFTQNGGEYHRISSNTSHSNTTASEDGSKTELSVNASAKSKVDTGFMAGEYEISAGANIANTEKTTTTGTDGSEDIDETITDQKNVTTDSSTWNTSQGFSNSKTTSSSKTVSNAISHIISQQYGYGKSYSEGGSNSASQELATTNSKSNEYSSAMTYYTSQINSTTTTFSSTGNTIGSYRMVMAGTVHVFATVGYDVATKSYFVYTYNVLDDKTEEYLDYSFDGTFNDYETSIIPFEVPYFVNEYVINRTAKSDGLILDPDTGMIVDYIPVNNEMDDIVIIPSYVAVDNNDGTYTSVKVIGIAPGLFKDNKNIVAVRLSKFINEIPELSFDGCSALKCVISPGVTKIGNNAFGGCSSLNTFTLSTDVTELGINAFKDTPDLSAIASSSVIAQAVASSGANKIKLDISCIPDEESDDMSFAIGDISTFELQGKDKEYKGLNVNSDARTTIINGITFTENTKIPIELSSSNVTLDRVTVDCSGYAIALKANKTSILLNRNINLMSSNENAVIAKSVEFANLNSSIVGKLNVTGNMLVCGTVDGEKHLNFNNGNIIYIEDEEYNNYLTSHKITFNANGGTVATNSKMVSLNMAIGELPVPSRDYYTFDGWYTEEDGGEKITTDTIMVSLTDITLYAHWIQNDVSAWTPVSEVPQDAEVVNRKWTYTLTSYTTSSASSLSGWNKYDTTWTWDGWSDWINYDPGTNNGNREVQTQWIDNSFIVHRYVYYHYCNSNFDTRASARSGYNYHEWDSDHPLNYMWQIDGKSAYGSESNCATGTSYLWFKKYEYDDLVSSGYTQWKYRDKIYTYYYKKNEIKESTEYPTGDNISNIQELIQYRTK